MKRMGAIYFVIALFGIIYWCTRTSAEKRSASRWEENFNRSVKEDRDSEADFLKVVCDDALEKKATDYSFLKGSPEDINECRERINNTWKKYTGEELRIGLHRDIGKLVYLASYGKIPSYNASYGIECPPVSNEGRDEFFQYYYIIQKILIDHGVNYPVYLTRRLLDGTIQFARWNGECATAKPGDPVWKAMRWWPSMKDYERRNIIQWPNK